MAYWVISSREGNYYGTPYVMDAIMDEFFSYTYDSPALRKLYTWLPRMLQPL